MFKQAAVQGVPDEEQIGNPRMGSVHKNPNDHAQEEVGLPQDMRIRLGHALIEHTAQQRGIKLLHIKGYAVDSGLYSPGRRSSDIDVLVHPDHIDEFVDVLLGRGWRTVTRFTSGSIFQHAMTLWHDSWGYADVHRSYPGIEISASDLFEELWRSRTSRLIADIPCTVPATHHQALLIVLHAARDPYRGASDVRYLRETQTPKEWDALKNEAERFGAGLAFAAATGGLDEFSNHPKHDVWAVVSGGGSRMELLAARARAAPSLRSRTTLLLSAAFTNRDHLRMSLQREPRLMDYVKELRGRIMALGSVFKVRRRK